MPVPVLEMPSPRFPLRIRDSSGKFANGEMLMEEELSAQGDTDRDEHLQSVPLRDVEIPDRHGS